MQTKILRKAPYTNALTKITPTILYQKKRLFITKKCRFTIELQMRKHNKSAIFTLIATTQWLCIPPCEANPDSNY